MTPRSGPPRGGDSPPGSEVSVVADGDGVRLAGSVWLPAAAAPRGLILMHPGSGPSDRDNDILFPPIRSALLAGGVAVCSFDKRGVGGSSGRWLEAGIERQADDLARGLRAAREIAPAGPVGLFGHSQGGWVVLEAVRLVRPAFVITNSGPSVSPFEQEEYSTRNRLRRAGWGAAEVDSGVLLFREFLGMARSGLTLEQARSHVAGRHDELRALADAGAFVPDSAAMWSHAASVLGYDPGPALADLDVPLLAIFGASDAVVPVADCVERLRRVVPSRLVHLDVVDGGDHRIQRDDTDEFVPGYLAALTAFVEGQLRGAEA